MKTTGIAGFLLAGMLLTGCNTQLISQQMVLSSAAVDVSQSPWQAKLEITLEEENEYITVEGNNFYELWENAGRLYGSPVYLGALECVLLEGVADRDEMLKLLQELQTDPQIGTNTQIALTDDALALYDGENIDGDAITALLTHQYSRSNDYSLKELTGLLSSEGRGALIPWIATEQDKAVIAGFTPSDSADYAFRWEGNEVLYLVTGRKDVSHLTLPKKGGNAEIDLTNPSVKLSGFTEAEVPVVKLRITATVLSIPSEGETISAAILEEAVKQELHSQLEEIQYEVVEAGNTDLFGIGKRMQLRNYGYFSHQKKDSAIYRVELRLRDPSGILLKS